MKYKIMVDSSADLPNSIIEKYNIEVIPLTINFDGEQYLDKFELSPSDFYKKLGNSNELPKTSQISPERFKEAFKKELDKGNKVVCITIASAASGTCQSAHIAKNELESQDVYIIDSGMLCMGTGMLTIKIARMLQQNKSIEEVIDMSDKIKDKIEHLFSVDTLKYLKMGGRIKGAKAAIAEVLNIKPILNVEGGMTQVIGKVRGRKKIISYFINHMKENIDLDKTEFISVAHSENLEEAQKLIEKIRETFLFDREILISDIGATIGTHAGPGVLAVFYVKK